jgi:hypothetical protein
MCASVADGAKHSWMSEFFEELTSDRTITSQWKISYKKRNLLAKIDLSGKQKPICGIEGPLYQSSYTEVVLEVTKGLSRNSCPK